MSSEERKKVIACIYYPRDDFLLEYFYLIRTDYMPDNYITLDCNLHEDVKKDTDTLQRIDGAYKQYNIIFLGAIYGKGGYGKTNVNVFNQNCAYLDKRYGGSVAMLNFEPEEIEDMPFKRVTDTMHDEFKDLKRCFARTMGYDFLFKEEELALLDGGDDADSESETDSETEPEKEKEKQDDVTSEEPEAKKMKSPEEN